MARSQLDPANSIYDLMAVYLHQLRIRNNMTQTAVGDLLGCTKGQVSKYESSDRHLDEDECAVLDTLWKTGGMFHYLLGYAKLGADPNWRTRIDRYQRTADVLRIFSNNIVPIPFQTEDYARSLLGAGYAAGLVEDVEAALERRMDLQSAMLDGNPEFWIVLDEIALRPMGNAATMAGQREHLLELGRSPRVSIRILPLTAAPHIGVDGSFWSFELPGRRLAAFAGTALEVGRVIDDQAEAATVAVRFHRIAARAWSEDQTREAMARIGEDI